MINTIKRTVTGMYNSSLDEHNRFGTISVLLIVVAIFGGLAIGSFLDNVFAMALISAGTMLTEAFILAVQPMKRIVNIALLSIAINIAFMLAGFMS
jgi:hypothetical protein